jgi:hypothetical protein
VGLAVTIDLIGSAAAHERMFDVYDLRSVPAPETLQLDDVAIAALRHAAARVCPCSPRTLAAVLTTALVGVVGSEADVANAAKEAVQALVGTGDLILAADGDTGERQIYLSPPMFVRSSATTVFLVGGFPEADWPLSRQSVPFGAYRRLSPAPTEDELRDLGIGELPLEAWLEHPTIRTSAEIVAQLEVALSNAGPAGTLSDLRIVDPDARPNYYIGRFVVPKKHTGRFVARRSRRFGADAWSYVELVDGEPTRFVDLPLIDGRFRACDEGWWLMCAIDAAQGRGQQLNVSAMGDSSVLAFSMPMPSWVERRLRVFGEPADRPRGSLFAVSLSSEDAAREIEFLRATMWLSPTEAK